MCLLACVCLAELEASLSLFMRKTDELNIGRKTLYEYGLSSSSCVISDNMETSHAIKDVEKSNVTEKCLHFKFGFNVEPLQTPLACLVCLTDIINIAKTQCDHGRQQSISEIVSINVHLKKKKHNQHLIMKWI